MRSTNFRTRGGVMISAMGILQIGRTVRVLFDQERRMLSGISRVRARIDRHSLQTLLHPCIRLHG